MEVVTLSWASETVCAERFFGDKTQIFFLSKSEFLNHDYFRRRREIGILASLA